MASLGVLASMGAHTLSVDVDIDVSQRDVSRPQLTTLFATALVDSPEECRGKAVSSLFERGPLVLGSSPQL